MGHVTHGVDMYHKGNKGNHRHHHCGEIIDKETHFETDAITDHPGINSIIEDRLTIKHMGFEHIQG